MSWVRRETRRIRLKQMVIEMHAIAIELTPESFAHASELRKVAHRLDLLAERLRKLGS